jgi:WD40 repeat protein
LITNSFGGIVRLWDLANGKPIGEALHVPKNNSVAFSPIGNVILSSTGDGSVRMWELPAYAPKITLSTDKSIGPFVYSSEHEIISATKDLVIHRAATSGRTSQVSLKRPSHSIVTPYRLSLNGARLLTKDSDGCVRVWDTLSGDILKTVSRSDLGQEDQAISYDGSLLSLTHNADKTVIISSVDVPDFDLPPIHLSSWVTNVCFSPSGEYVVTAGQNTMQQWAVCWFSVIWKNRLVELAR